MQCLIRQEWKASVPGTDSQEFHRSFPQLGWLEHCLSEFSPERSAQPSSTRLFICPSYLLHQCLLPSLQLVCAALLFMRVLCVPNPCLGALARNPPFGPDVTIVALLTCTNDLHLSLFQELLLGRLLKDTSPSCLLSKRTTGSRTWQSSIDYCSVPDLCFWNAFMKQCAFFFF